ncbi:MAG: helix-turn-helix domain-containing protein [Methanospirillum sp.]|nr:helix-turn-helix domain-containing protein [Methanospirillum sp.]
MFEEVQQEEGDLKKIRLLSPDDEQARLIGKAIASETAGKIMGSMEGREVTANVLAEELAIPVSTVMYHLENLVAAGLIEVSRTRYSVKGREMKVYRIIDQVLIVSSKSQDIRAVLTRCAALFSLPFMVSVILYAMTLIQASRETNLVLANSAMQDVAGEGYAGTGMYAMEKSVQNAPFPAAAPLPVMDESIRGSVTPFISWGDIAIGVIAGALLVIIVLLVLDYIRLKKGY